MDALEVDELTQEPVESSHGFHGIRRSELDVVPLEEQCEKLEATINDGYIQNNQAFMTELVTKLAKKANVQIQTKI